jgi:hypothetical protein
VIRRLMSRTASSVAARAIVNVADYGTGARTGAGILAAPVLGLAMAGSFAVRRLARALNPASAACPVFAKGVPT